MWGKPIFGIVLQIDLERNVQDEISSCQRELEILEPGSFLFPERPYRHISFEHIGFWGGQYVFENSWEEISKEFMRLFLEQDKKFPSFLISFEKYVATKNALIWGAFDENDELEILRAIFLAKLPFPKEMPHRNHIIHTTIARYRNTLNNPRAVLKYLHQRKEKIKMRVNTITLRRELLFPSLKTETLARIQLY